jgi:hypothetical protein
MQPGMPIQHQAEHRRSGALSTDDEKGHWVIGQREPSQL